ncbi:exported hypothetical protein [Syntrophobacter sp. SbD2]|nr:exported hypothetical protein [Syntrophobacter sp. SbD2]
MVPTPVTSSCTPLALCLPSSGRTAAAGSEVFLPNSSKRMTDYSLQERKNRRRKMRLSYMASARPPVHLPNESLTFPLRKAAESFAGKIAVIEPEAGGREWTYAELEERSSALAASLNSLGVQTGDRVGVWLKNSKSGKSQPSWMQRKPRQSLRHKTGIPRYAAWRERRPFGYRSPKMGSPPTRGLFLFHR